MNDRAIRRSSVEERHQLVERLLLSLANAGGRAARKMIHSPLEN
jgi:hypothetical protein